MSDSYWDDNPELLKKLKDHHRNIEDLAYRVLGEQALSLSDRSLILACLAVIAAQLIFEDERQERLNRQTLAN